MTDLIELEFRVHAAAVDEPSVSVFRFCVPPPPRIIHKELCIWRWLGFAIRFDDDLYREHYFTRENNIFKLFSIHLFLLSQQICSTFDVSH